MILRTVSNVETRAGKADELARHIASELQLDVVDATQELLPAKYDRRFRGSFGPGCYFPVLAVTPTLGDERAQETPGLWAL